MKALRQLQVLFIFIGIAAVISSCRKSDIKPKKQKTTVLTVSTLAGSGAPGTTNGTGIAASFTSPSALAINSAGALIVGDWGSNLIREINPGTAAVTTYAGTGAQGWVNGAALSAKFWGPANIVIDKNGNVFVSDEQNNAIREVTSTGNVITIAGTGVAGFQNGPISTATFNHPDGIVVDANGDLYVADNANNAIRKITISTGMVSTFAGTGAVGYNNGAGAGATFHSPYGLAMDSNGDLYVADIVNNVIRKITVSTDMVSTFAGSGAQGFTNGTTATATFYYPIGLAFDSSGNLFVSDFRNNSIRKIGTDGTVSTYAGNGTQGATDAAAASASFNQPIGLAVDAGGNVYVADENNNKIRKITATQQ